MRNAWIRKLGLASVTFLGLAAGAVSCKGCAKQEAPRAEEEVESQHARLLSRMADLKIDHSKVYPKNVDGVVACAEDTLCFVLQAETCVRATLSRKVTISGYGMNDEIEGEYAITGTETGRCRITRHIRSTDTHIEPRLIDALRAEGKSESDIAVLQTNASDKLRGSYPPRFDCWFGSDDALEVALDLADGKINDRLFRENCSEVSDDPQAAPNEAPEDDEEAAPGQAAAPGAKPAAKPAAEKPGAGEKPAAAETPAAKASAAAKDPKVGKPAAASKAGETKPTGEAAAKTAAPKP